MPESNQLPQNRHPVNQASLVCLKKVGQDPDPNSLYALQLAQWALESGELEAGNPDLKENVDQLLTEWEPKEALKMLTLNADQEPVDLLRGIDVNDPLQVSEQILEQIHSNLAATLPGYSRPLKYS